MGEAVPVTRSSSRGRSRAGDDLRATNRVTAIVDDMDKQEQVFKPPRSPRRGEALRLTPFDSGRHKVASKANPLLRERVPAGRVRGDRGMGVLPTSLTPSVSRSAGEGDRLLALHCINSLPESPTRITSPSRAFFAPALSPGTSRDACGHPLTNTQPPPRGISTAKIGVSPPHARRPGIARVVSRPRAQRTGAAARHRSVA